MIDVTAESTVCRLAFIMQQTFSLHLMQRQTTGTTTDDTSTHYNATVSATIVRLRKRVKAERNPKTLGAMQRK